MIQDRWQGFIPEEDLTVYAAAGYGAMEPLGSSPALVVVDVTYSFCGLMREPIMKSIERWPNSCGERAWDAIYYIREIIRVARKFRVPVVYTQGCVESQAAGARALGKSSRSAEWVGVGNEIVQEVAPEADDVVMVKAAPSAFFESGLRARLLDLGVDSVIVCGATTSGCVRATVVDAFSYGLRPIVAGDATFDRGILAHFASLFDIEMKYGSVMNSERIVQYLSGGEGSHSGTDR